MLKYKDKSMKILKLARHPYFLLFLILILAVLLRLPSLGQAFWGDEILSLQIVKHYQGDLTGMINYLRMVEVHPPLYYLLLSFWTHYFGFAEAAVRSLSLLFGLAIVVLSYFLGKQMWKSGRAGLLAALLVAIMPMPIMFSQEARPYIIFSFFGLLGLYQLNRYLEKRNWMALIYFSIFSIIGLYLHYSFIFILIPFLFWWLLRIIIDKRRGDFTRFLLVITFIFLGFYWWLSAMFYKAVLGSYELMGMSRSLFYGRAIYFIESSLNQLVWTAKNRQIASLEIFTILLIKIIVFVDIFKLVIKKGKSVWRNFLPFVFLIITSLLLFIFSPASENYSSIFEKHIFWLSILIALFLAGLAANLKTKAAAVLIGLLAVSFITFDVRILFNQVNLDQDRVQKTIAEQINIGFVPGDIVIDNFSFNRSNLNYYLRDDIYAYGFYPARLLDWRSDMYASRETLGILENEAQSRIWPVLSDELDVKMNYIIHQSSPSRIWLAYADYEDHGLKSWLEAHGWRHALVSIGHFFPLDLYVKK